MQRVQAALEVVARDKNIALDALDKVLAGGGVDCQAWAARALCIMHTGAGRPRDLMQGTVSCTPQ